MVSNFLILAHKGSKSALDRQIDFSVFANNLTVHIGEVRRGGSVAVAVGFIYIQQATGDTQYLTHDI